MILSVVMPTITGREQELARSIEAYERLTPLPIEWVIEHDHPTCAAAWDAGVPKTTGEILHMGADDIEPATDEWFPAALKVIEQGNVPLGWVMEHGVTFGRDFARVVICRREWWRDINPELHYWSDNQFDDLMRESGHQPVVAEGFDFLHRKSLIGRPDEAGWMERDRRIYERG